MGRTLSQILGDAKVGVRPTLDECYYALLALDALGTFDGAAIRRLARVPSVRTGTAEYTDRFRLYKAALRADPKTWLGPNNDPTRPEVAKRVKASRALVDRLSKEAPDAD